jgi:hypothetical protein
LAFYTFRRENDDIVSREFDDDDAAIAHAVRAAQGGLIEVWRSCRLLASVDERPDVHPTVRGALELPRTHVTIDKRQNVTPSA